MNENFKATLKSAETEDWLDLHVIRPFCYYLAVFFNKFDIHPNDSWHDCQVRRADWDAFSTVWQVSRGSFPSITYWFTVSTCTTT